MTRGRQSPPVVAGRKAAIEIVKGNCREVFDLCRKARKRPSAALPAGEPPESAPEDRIKRERPDLVAAMKWVVEQSVPELGHSNGREQDRLYRAAGLSPYLTAPRFLPVVLNRQEDRNRRRSFYSLVHEEATRSRFGADKTVRRYLDRQRPLAFAGRKAELEIVKKSCRQGEQTASHIVVFRGAPGAGKSSLQAHIRKFWIEENDPLVVSVPEMILEKTGALVRKIGKRKIPFQAKKLELKTGTNLWRGNQGRLALRQLSTEALGTRIIDNGFRCSCEVEACEELETSGVPPGARSRRLRKSPAPVFENFLPVCGL